MSLYLVIVENNLNTVDGSPTDGTALLSAMFPRYEIRSIHEKRLEAKATAEMNARAGFRSWVVEVLWHWETIPEGLKSHE